MKISPKPTLFVLCLLVLTTSMVFASPMDDLGAIFQSPPPHPVGTFDDFSVVVSDSSVGQLAVYTFSFTMDRSDFKKLNKGGFAFSFPTGFDLSSVSEVTLAHNSEAAEYRVKKVEVTDDLVVVKLKRTQWYPQNDDLQIISVSVSLELVSNPVTSGSYQFGGLAFYHTGAILAGPAISESLEIVPGSPVSIEVEPSDDLTLRAGEIIVFEAVMFDAHGNLVPASNVEWTLKEGSDPIGFFTGSTLHVAVVGLGRVQAKVENVVGLSGQIIVLPGALARIKMDIETDHVVGHPLLPESRLILYDAFDNLKTDFDLADNPLMLSTGTGTLTPAIIDDPGILNDGTIDLTAAGVVYDGPTAQTTLTVETADRLVSTDQTVSFSGYDILAVLGEDDLPLESLAAEGENVVKVVVVNNGALIPDTASVILAFQGYVKESWFLPGPIGQIDTVVRRLIVHSGAVDEENLYVGLEAQFVVDGQALTARDEVDLIVSLVEPVELTIVPGQFWPDSLYPGSLTRSSLDVTANEPLEITSGPFLRITLTNDGGATEVPLAQATGYSSIAGNLIRHSDVPTTVRSADLLPSGWYDVILDYSFVSEGITYVISHKAIDSVFVLSEIEVTYVEGSFGPAIVNAGSESSFGFTVNLLGDYSVPIDPSGAIIEIFGNDFLSSSLLRIADQTLHPGLNLVTTDPVFIPAEQQGQVLSFKAGFEFVIPGAQVGFEFATDFSTAAVHVGAAPVVKIISVDMLAPNAPQVNTGQSFQVHARVANVSATLLGPLDMVLRTDGSSTFDSILTIDSLEGYDTTNIYFNIVAAGDPVLVETFRVAVGSPHIGAEEPDDDLATAVIETPAQLSLDYSLAGVEGGIVDYGQHFSLVVELVNEGQAGTSAGEYVLLTDGIDLGIGEDQSGSIAVGQHLDVDMWAPEFDTSITLTFIMASIPIDSNTSATAIMDDTDFVSIVVVRQIDAELLVKGEVTGSHLVVPGRKKELFRLIFTNRGTSESSAVSLDELSFTLRGSGDQILDAFSVIDRLSSEFLWNGGRYPFTFGEGDDFAAIFEDLIVEPQQTCTLAFVGTIHEIDISQFGILLESDKILASYERGSLAGQPVDVSSIGGDGAVVDQVFVVSGSSLKESFVARDNPVDPTQTTIEFSYELAGESDIEFRVFTLTGEEVYERYIVGQAGATGEQMLQWDGRNDKNQLVNNGVYVVSLRVLATGEIAMLKLAVIK